MQTKLGRPLAGRRVHFVGVGGVGMAALAELLHSMDYEISGSDLKSSRPVERLLELGVPVTVGRHRPESVDGADHVIVSNAVPDGNIEVESAERAGVDVLSRADLLGRFLDAGRGIAVSGTHGKTTTASMVASALEGAGFDPSFLIGGDLNDVGSGARLGTSDLVVAEADEAFGSFLHLRPELALVTNVDLDHLEFYEDQDAIDEAFVQFFANRRDGGAAVIYGDDPGLIRIAHRIEAPVVRYGIGLDADLGVGSDGSLRWRGEEIGTLDLRMPGRHNVLNAAGAVAAGLVLGADPDRLIEALRTFGGVERRFSIRGEEGGVLIVDDYAHNPQKVAATLAAARSAYPGRRVVALFQPHLYSRTLHLAQAFGRSFDDADTVFVTDVYAAREEPIPGVSGRLITDAIRERSADKMVVYVPRLEEATGVVAGFTEPGDIVLTLGAGDVTSAAGRILELLKDLSS